MYALEVHNVSKNYRIYRKPVDRLKEIILRKPFHSVFYSLSNISFVLPHGGSLGIIGDNGAGKSSLLKILANTLSPTAGKVVTQGRVAALLELGAGFHPEFTGRQNIYLNAKLLGLEDKEVAAREEEIIAFSELGEFIDRPVKTYSSGMYVRLAFSVATVVDPDILIIDEALSVGDAHFQKKCADRITQFKEKGKTILFCSHNLYIIRELCSEAIWLANGAIQHYGASVEVISAYTAYLENREAGGNAQQTQEAPAALPAVTIQSIRVADEQGNPLDSLKQFQTVVITIVTKRHGTAPVKGYVGIVLLKPDDQWLFGASTKHAGLEPMDFIGEQATQLVIPSLPLGLGACRVRGIVGDESGFHAFHEHTTQPFVITSASRGLGMLWMEHHWNPFRKSAAPADASKPFSLVFSFYSPDGNALSMPLACMSAYVKQKLAGVETHLAAINIVIGGEDNSVEGYVRRVARHHPDLIAISSMSPHWEPLDPYLRALKTHFPSTPIVVGGYQAILAPETTIAHPAVDYICTGDGEKPLAAPIQRLRGEAEGYVPGLWEQTASGEIVKSPPVLAEDLSAMPFPDYALYEENGSLRGLGLSIFGPQGLFILPVMTGRGCPYRCTYCCNTPLLEMWRGKGKYIRKYDPQRLVDELCRLRDRYQVDYFEFWDELFLVNMKFAYHFLELYEKHIHLPFSINSRVEKMDEKFCQTAAKAGCHTIWFGIESGSESYRIASLERTMTNEQIIVAAENARKAGIRRLTFNIIGMPFETRAHMLETLELNKTISPEFFFFFPYIPLKGTPLYEIAEKASLLSDKTAPDYLSAIREGRPNLKEHEGGVSNSEFKEICELMQKFQHENNTIGL